MKLQDILVIFAGVTAACAPSPSSDAAADSASDASADSASSPETGVDSGALADSSATPDALADGAGSDAGACSLYQGNSSWTARLTVEPGARLCAYPARQWSANAGETQEQMRVRLIGEAFAQKSTITIPAGDYALPTVSESRAFLLPMCINDASGAVGPATASATVSVSEGSGIGSTPDGPNVEARFMLGADALALRINRPASAGAAASLAASPQAEHYRGVNITRGTQRLYASCALRANRCTNLSFGAMGVLRLEEHYWQAMPGFGFSAPVRARGELAGSSIDVSDYGSMAAIYARHAFERTFVFRLRAPINGACALRVDLSDLGGPTVATLADCDGAPMGARLAVTSTMATCD